MLFCVCLCRQPPQAAQSRWRSPKCTVSRRKFSTRHWTRLILQHKQSRTLYLLIRFVRIIYASLSLCILFFVVWSAGSSSWALTVGKKKTKGEKEKGENRTEAEIVIEKERGKKGRQVRIEAVCAWCVCGASECVSLSCPWSVSPNPLRCLTRRDSLPYCYRHHSRDTSLRDYSNFIQRRTGRTQPYTISRLDDSTELTVQTP